MKCFLDTNVIVDLLLERTPFYEAAATILTLADEQDFMICTSALSIANAHYICCERAKMPVDMWRKKIVGLGEMLSFLSLDEQNIKNACAVNWKDFEDSLQYFSAKRNGCDFIVTRNAKDFLLSDIAVVTPEKFIDNIL